MSTPHLRCAIYTRKSSEEGLEQSFNSLHAQREACEAYIRSQKHEGWQIVKTIYDDGGFSGGNLQRPAMQRLLEDIAAKKVDVVVVYKVDRLTRSLTDFAKIVEQFDKQGVSFVSVTQQFNTTSSMGRLTLNVLLSFAQFEREVTGERIRDKIAASKRKGMWMGGVVPAGYELQDRQLIINSVEADQIRYIYKQYLDLDCVSKLQTHLESRGIRSKQRMSKRGRVSGGVVYSRGALYEMLKNRIYLGEITHKDAVHEGLHEAIVDREIWEQVQEKLKNNLQSEHRRPRATTASLLTGLLYDENGNRFTPTHAAKGERRYRYYVLQKNEDTANKETIRLPAPEVEELVISEFRTLLNSQQSLLDMLSDESTPIADTQAIMASVTKSELLNVERLKDAIRLTTQRVVVLSDRLELHICKRTLRSVLTGQSFEKAGIAGHDIDVLSVEAEFLRKRGKVRLILPPHSIAATSRENSSIVQAVAKAHDWLNRILNGTVVNQRALATEAGVDERYISRILPLALLAPDITEAILGGRQPTHLALKDYVQSFPTEWNAQRRALSVSQKN